MRVDDEADGQVGRKSKRTTGKILFGSQARGSADARSDADILVICELDGNRRQLMTAMDRTLRGLRLARDIVVLTPSEYERDRVIPGTVARAAWREGNVLYERCAEPIFADVFHRTNFYADLIHQQALLTQRLFLTALFPILPFRHDYTFTILFKPSLRFVS